MRLARAAAQRVWLGLLLVLSGLGSAEPARANQGTLEVQVMVEVTCRVLSGSLDFGTYVSGQSAPLLGQGSIGFEDCPAGQLSFALDGGGAGNVAKRQLSDGAGHGLAYQLYRDPARKSVLGAGKSALAFTIDERGSGSVTVYGTVPGRQRVPAGLYTDTVGVTLTF
jgi:spore coat protein U-like protein